MTSPSFAPRSDKDVLQLVLENPLAWVVSHEAEGFRATLLPLRPMTDAQARITSFTGHFARSNDHVAPLQRSARAVLLFLGPHGYISPSWMRERTWVPTWNYAAAQFVVDLEFFEDPLAIETHLRDLVDTMEAGRPHPWNVTEAGKRYATLARHVIGFQARVHSARTKFKLGQDERDEVFRDITVALARSGEDELSRWMDLFNSNRNQDS